MKKFRSILLNIILPAFIITVLLDIMAGCIYIPTFDHTLLAGTKKDFRHWGENHKDLPKPQLALLDRHAIESMFGKPPFASPNGKCVAYVMGSEHDIWIWPLCFGAGFANGNTHVLKLVYDDHNRLKKVIPLEHYRSPPFYMFGSDIYAANSGGTTSHADPIRSAADLLQDVERTCPEDEELGFTDVQRVTTQPVP